MTSDAERYRRLLDELYPLRHGSVEQALEACDERYLPWLSLATLDEVERATVEFADRFGADPELCLPALACLAVRHRHLLLDRQYERDRVRAHAEIDRRLAEYTARRDAGTGTA